MATLKRNVAAMGPQNVKSSILNREIIQRERTSLCLYKDWYQFMVVNIMVTFIARCVLDAVLYGIISRILRPQGPRYAPKLNMTQ